MVGFHKHTHTLTDSNHIVEGEGKEESGEKGKSGKEEEGGDPSLDTLV